MHCAKALILLVCTGLACLVPAGAAASFSGESALRFTQRLVAFGPRPAGSEAHAAMERYIEAQLKLFGCETEQLSWTAQTPLGPKPMKNLLVRVPGASRRPVVISGHYDTKLMEGIRFVGANDGGSSGGFLLELARTACRKRGADPLWLLWLDGEEAFREWTDTDSLYGSRWMAEKWTADGTAGRIKALFNVDMIGDRELNLLPDFNSDTELRKLFWRTGREMGFGEVLPEGLRAIADDHLPFGKAGIPVLEIIDFDYGPANSYWHTDRDTVDKLSARSFQIVGDILLRVLAKPGGVRE